MPLKSKNIENNSSLKKETDKIISGAYIPWNKSKDEVWQEMENRMSLSAPEGKIVTFNPWIRVAVAAVFALLLGITVVMQLYTKTLSIPAGQNGTYNLPDNSSVTLNAQSTLSYKPLWWNFSRKVRFEGEAFFEVQNGKKFEVTSYYGKTIVLGTSFNIYSRNNKYQVTCISGLVKVVEKKNQNEVLLNMGQKVTLSPKGIFNLENEVNTEQILSWTENRFSFTSVPLLHVFEELGRQYGVSISAPGIADKIYTGTFIRHDSVTHALNLVCKPFNLKFTRKSENEYIISKTD